MNRLLRDWYFSADDLAAGSSAAEQSAAQGGAADAGGAEAQAASQAGSTAQTIDLEAIKQASFEAGQKGTLAAIEQFQAEAKAAEAAKLAQQQQQRQFAADPVSEALAAMDLREALYDDVAAITKSLPGDIAQEVSQHVRTQMRQFGSTEALQIVKAQELHKTLADAAIGRLVREGRYAAGGGTVAPSREPINSEPPAKVPQSFRQEQDEVCRILGVTLTEAELVAAWQNR